MSRHLAPNKIHALSLAIATSLSATAFAEDTQQEEQQQPSYMMNQVVVTATRTENNLATAPASMSVIGGEEVQARPHTALNDIVSEAVGVESMKTGGRAGRELISIRGMDSKYTMILVNGRKVSSSNAIVRGNDFDYSSIPQDNIEQIEIIRGPMSALYGSEAMGGVINIITKVPDNEWRSSISSDYSRPEGSDGGAEYMIGLNTGGALIDDELYLNLSINKSARDAWKPYSGNDATATPLEKRDTLSFSGGLNWLINDQQTLDLDVTYADDQREGVIKSTQGLTPTDQKVKRNSVAITHGGEWDWGDSQVRYTREEVEFGEFDFDQTFQREYATELSNTIDGSVSTDINNHRLTLGGEIRKTELDNKRDFVETGKSDIQEEALFIQDEWTLSDKWALTYGTRLDHHENFGTEFSPRAYLVNTVSDKLTVKGGVGKAFNAPTMAELDREYRLPSCKNGCYMTGNPDLNPETSVSYELAANYQEENWMVEAAIFRNEVDDLIARDLDNVVGDHNGRDVYTYKNVDKARIDGIELGGRIHLTKDVSLKADYTYIDAQDKTNKQKLENRPQQTTAIGLDWQATQKLNTFVKASYTGRQKLSTKDNVDLDGFTLVDVGLNYHYSDDLRLRAGISNLTNKKLSDEARDRGVTVDPRTWYVGFTTHF